MAVHRKVERHTSRKSLRIAEDIQQAAGRGHMWCYLEVHTTHPESYLEEGDLAVNKLQQRCKPGLKPSQTAVHSIVEPRKAIPTSDLYLLSDETRAALLTACLRYHKDKRL